MDEFEFEFEDGTFEIFPPVVLTKSLAFSLRLGPCVLAALIHPTLYTVVR